MEVVIITNFSSEIRIIAPLTDSEGVTFNSEEKALKFLEGLTLEDAVVYLSGYTKFNKDFENKYEDNEGVVIKWL